MRAGARGYLMRDASREVLLKAVRTVHRGNVYLSEELQSKLLRGLAEGGHARKAEKDKA
jgi:DNA-binding NarL/FixJ family response regulator